MGGGVATVVERDRVVEPGASAGLRTITYF
jgi:hypothetical protein